MMAELEKAIKRIQAVAKDYNKALSGPFQRESSAEKLVAKGKKDVRSGKLK